MILFKHIKLTLMALIGISLLSCSSGPSAMEKAKLDSLSLTDSIVKPPYKFEKDTLSGSSLKAFELRATQKLFDVADYIQILTDPSIDKSFRMQAKQMMLDIFSDATNTVSIHATETENPEKFSVNEFVEKMLKSHFPKLKVEVKKVQTKQIQQRKDKDTYARQLIYQQSVYRIDPTRKVQLNEHMMKANILLARITKAFGTTTEDVWIVFLGNIEVDDN